MAQARVIVTRTPWQTVSKMGRNFYFQGNEFYTPANETQAKLFTELVTIAEDKQKRALTKNEVTRIITITEENA